MIRINLLATERKAEKKKSTVAPGAVQAYLFLGLFGGGAALVCAGGFWLKSAQIKELDTRIGEAEARQRQLQAIKKQVEDFEAKKRLIEQKVQLIDKLKADQASAVHMLDELSKALPDFVWLSQMDHSGGGLKLTGQSNSLSSVADFITNLTNSGWFKAELESSQEQSNIVSFVVNATFTNQAAAEAAKAAAAAAAKPAAPAGAPAPPAAAAANKS
jgi:type IV pilus assembly protein PilN